MMMLEDDVRGSRRRRWATSKPSSFGIITSRRTRSGRSSTALSKPSSPFEATVTSYPADRRFTSTNRATSGSSSTTRTDSVIGSPPGQHGEPAGGLAGVPGLEDRGRGGEDGRAGGQAPGPGPLVDPPVHLDLGRQALTVDLFPDLFDLRQRLVQELLPGPSGVDAHHQDTVQGLEIGEDLLHLGLRVDGQARLHPKVAGPPNDGP